MSEVADAKKAEDVKALDVRELRFTDFLVNCTARNERQAKAISKGGLPAAEAGPWDAARHRGGRLRGGLGADGLSRCILHVFVPELRERYRLEVLCGEAPRLELELQAVRGPTERPVGSRASPSDPARARCSASSAPTAPERRRRSGPCSICCTRPAGRARLFGLDSRRDSVAIRSAAGQPAGGLRLRQSVGPRGDSLPRSPPRDRRDSDGPRTLAERFRRRPAPAPRRSSREGIGRRWG